MLAQATVDENLVKTIRNFIRASMSRELVLAFSWSGRGAKKDEKKHCFRKHPLMNVLRGKFRFIIELLRRMMRQAVRSRQEGEQ